MGKYSDYKGVSYTKLGSNKNAPWIAAYKTNGHNWHCHYETERAAALAYDVKMAEIGK